MPVVSFKNKRHGSDSFLFDPTDWVQYDSYLKFDIYEYDNFPGDDGKKRP